MGAFHIFVERALCTTHHSAEMPPASCLWSAVGHPFLFSLRTECSTTHISHAQTCVSPAKQQAADGSAVQTCRQVVYRSTGLGVESDHIYV